MFSLVANATTGALKADAAIRDVDDPRHLDAVYGITVPKAKDVKHRRSKQIKVGTPSTEEVSANQVMSTLVGLFDDLGLSISHPNIGAIAGHNLYPYTSVIGELLTYWYQHPDYLDENGNPVSIKFAGRAPSFRHLCRLKAPKIDATYLLSEFERLGAVSIDERDLISVQRRSFPVHQDKRLAAQHTLSALDGFMRTLRHNLDSGPSNSDQLFHRIARNDGFDSREIPALKIRIKRYGQSFLESFDDWLMRKTSSNSRSKKRGSKRAKVSIGIYLSVEQK